MPNWCENVVTIKGPREKIAAMEAAADEGRFLDFLRPQPEGLLDDTNERNKGAMPDWWSWRVDNWGCKWEIPIGPNNEYDETSVTWSDDEVWIAFLSAWAPPLEAFKYAAENMGLEIVAYYYEPAMCFAGRFDANSQGWHDNYVDDISIGPIPQDIDDEFMITEQRKLDEEWEAEDA